MNPTQVLQEIRKMRFEESYVGWNEGRLTQAEAPHIRRVCERSFRRYMLPLLRVMVANHHGKKDTRGGRGTHPISTARTTMRLLARPVVTSHMRRA